jgi:xanthine phosphoribosyltransferase
MNKKYYSYGEFIHDMVLLVKRFGRFNPDSIVAISRGGLTMGHFLAEYLNIRDFYIIKSISYDEDKHLEGIKISDIPHLMDKKNTLIVDEIVDSGQTLKKVIELLTLNYPDINFKSATIFQKDDAEYKADFSVASCEDWIEFFWEVDMKRSAKESLSVNYNNI